MKVGETGRVGRVTDGDTFTLEGGLRVRLSAIAAPGRGEAFSAEAKAGLRALVGERRVRLSYGGDTRDRYGRALAQVHTLGPDGTPDLWVQAEALRLGLARVVTWPGETVDSGALLAVEDEARRAGRGLWALPDYAVRSPEPNALAQDVDSLQIVEGIVLDVATVRGRTYLNFGADYRSDFTVVVAKKHAKRFAALDLASLEGARVRVRGWVELMNGPMMWASHPARIEVLD